ncbi:MAG: hypothetical protein JWR38_50 [Mucilaginibacter sp.]|nr:hypothetical protein [Mucilaginibacter sp.]
MLKAKIIEIFIKVDGFAENLRLQSRYKEAGAH